MLETGGVVYRVDPIDRELAALVKGILMIFYVPPSCSVVLRGERVKFRMVQPRDRVRVTYTEFLDGLVAHKIEVQPDQLRCAITEIPQ